MTSSLKENESTNVARRADMLIGVRRCKNFVLNQSIPLDLITHFCEKYPATNGKAT